MPPRTYTKEADVKAEVKKLLTHHEWLWWMPPGNGFGKAGVADFNAAKQGHFMALETKFGRNPPTAPQRTYLTSVRDEGCFSFVVNEKTLLNLRGFLSAFDLALAKRPSTPVYAIVRAPGARPLMDY